MMIPRDREMSYEDLEKLAFYYMFISCCLTEDEEQSLKEAWNKQGGYKVIPWWKFVMENTKVSLDIKK